MTNRTSSQLQGRLRWLTAIRLLAVICFVLPFFLLYGSATIEGETSSVVVQFVANDVIQLLVGGASIQTLLYIALLRLLRHRPVIHAYIQFLGDLFLVTLMIYRLGANAHSVSILYLVVIVVASVFLRRAAGLVIAMLAFLGYAAVVFAPGWDWVRNLEARFPKLKPTIELRLIGDQRTYNLLVHLLGFHALAIMSSYLARDVTRAEERLRVKDLDLASLEIVHRDVVQSIASGLVTTDLAGLVTSINLAGEAMLGVAAQELIGTHVSRSRLLGAEQWNELTEHMGTGVVRRELEIRVGENPAVVDLSLSHLRDPEGARRGYLVVLHDLTERRRLEEELRFKDRMAAIGEMAAGLAHEVGNPLAAISGAVQMLTRSMPVSGAQSKLLEITLKESQRLDRTVKSFLQLARPPERRLVDFDVAALLAEEVELLGNSDEVRGRCEVLAEFDPPSATIRADPDQVSQIFWNLARNALRAMPDGGELSISGRLSERHYLIQFEDTGRGMADHVKDSLFQPFHSFFDEGTGIGMAIVYRIVEEHDGEIDAESHPGRGSVIRIRLPIAGPAEPSAASLELQESLS